MASDSRSLGVTDSDKEHETSAGRRLSSTEKRSVEYSMVLYRDYE